MAHSLKDLSDKMQDIDFCMLSTREAAGSISCRPMSNNGDVEYDGDSWFFSYDNTRKVRAIDHQPEVALSFTGSPSLLGSPGIFITIEGRASIIRDKAEFEKHWVKDLDMWFPQGIDTPGMVLLKVRAEHIEYWDGDENHTVSAR